MTSLKDKLDPVVFFAPVKVWHARVVAEQNFSGQLQVKSGLNFLLHEIQEKFNHEHKNIYYCIVFCSNVWTEGTNNKSRVSVVN